MDPAAAPAPGYERLLLFDGVCGFCDRAVRWMLERDPEGLLKYAPLQGVIAAELRTRHPEISESLDTVVYVDATGGSERVYFRTQAVLRACSALGRTPPALVWLSRLPQPLADLLYQAFARVRYRVFGRFDACRVPAAEERSRFLD